MIEPKTLTYFDLFDLLKSLESHRLGIYDRVWNFINSDKDLQFCPINGRLSHMNLYFYGVGNEYNIKGITTEDIEHSKKIFTNAFIEESTENELRKDFNLIWYICQDHMTNDDIEMFYFMVKW